MIEQTCGTSVAMATAEWLEWDGEPSVRFWISQSES